MGVPAFFRWLSRKYPSIVVNCNEDKPKEVDGVKVPVDCRGPNPNGVEFDNLYLDMNGIVHPCTHPEDKPAPKNEDEMMVAIFEAIDRIFAIVRPRRVLYMAVDGVAPRAKMNQQRSRRFRAAKDAREKRETIQRIRDELAVQGIPLPPSKKAEEHFDSNCITPGTPFMTRLSDCLQYYAHDRLTNDPSWRNLCVIISDASVPGEGEHKIMDFIRRQRSSPGHDPNTKHVLCGADADLIMLGLATHEPYFTIIREEFVPNQQKPCELCGQFGHELNDCQGLAKIKSGEYDEIADPFQREKNYIFIRLNILREYLQKELFMPNLPFTYDFERAVDDWVFMCFFVGNDFLPHLPSLEIRENAIDRLIGLYKNCVYKTRGYLTENGLVNLSRVQLIMLELGQVEDIIFKERQQNEVDRKERERKKQRRIRNAMSQSVPSFFPTNEYAPKAIDKWDRHGSVNAASVRSSAYNYRQNFVREQQQQQQQQQQSRSYSTDNRYRDRRQQDNNYGGCSSLNDKPSRTPDQSNSGQRSSLVSYTGRGMKRKVDDAEENEQEQEPYDEVRLWEDGWKDRYYRSKFEVTADDYEFRYKVGRAYVEGLCWVLRYYYQGCCSWVWYFPYHYAPFASDFVDLSKLKIEFDSNTTAIKPFEQLMSVFPADSRSHVPGPWAELMINVESSIIDFYPSDFKVDLNGKKFAWQGVALLPFVDAERLNNALVKVYDQLTPEEQRRNTKGNDRLLVNVNHKVYGFIKQIYEGSSQDWMTLDGKWTNGMSGLLKIEDSVTLPNETFKSPLVSCKDITNNLAISILFMDPQFDSKFIFPANRLPGAEEPPATLKPEHWNEDKKYRPQIGFTRNSQVASITAAGKRFLNAGLHCPEPRYDNGLPSFNNPYNGQPPFRAPSYPPWQGARPSAMPHHHRPILQPMRHGSMPIASRPRLMPPIPPFPTTNRPRFIDPRKRPSAADHF